MSTEKECTKMIFDALAKIMRNGAGAKVISTEEYNAMVDSLPDDEASRHFIMYCLYEGLLALIPSMEAQRQAVQHGFYKMLHCLVMTRAAMEARAEQAALFQGDLPLAVTKQVKEACGECRRLISDSYAELHAFRALLVLLAESYSLPQLRRIKLDLTREKETQAYYARVLDRVLALCYNATEREAVKEVYGMPNTAPKRIELGVKTQVRNILSKARTVDVSFRGLVFLLKLLS